MIRNKYRISQETQALYGFGVARLKKLAAWLEYQLRTLERAESSCRVGAKGDTTGAMLQSALYYQRAQGAIRQLIAKVSQMIDALVDQRRRDRNGASRSGRGGK